MEICEIYGFSVEDVIAKGKLASRSAEYGREMTKQEANPRTTFLASLLMPVGSKVPVAEIQQKWKEAGFQESMLNLTKRAMSPGFLDGSEGARERAGLPADTGPWRVVTPAAIYDYDENRCLRLIAVSAWTSVSEVLEECDSKPRLADTIEVLAPPTEEELNIYRTELDVRGQTSDRGDWITFNGERYERVRE